MTSSPTNESKADDAWDLLPEGWAKRISAYVRRRPGNLVTREFTINSAADCFVDNANPQQNRLLIADNFGAGKKRCRITYNIQASNDVLIPHARQVVATINVDDPVNALGRLKHVVNGAGTVNQSDARHRVLSPTRLEVEWDLSESDIDIKNVYMGAWLPVVGAGNVPVEISVELW